MKINIKCNFYHLYELFLIAQIPDYRSWVKNATQKSFNLS